MKPISLLPPRSRLAVLIVAGVLLAGCSTGSDAPLDAPTGGVAPPASTVVPTAWIDATTAAWPGSDGRTPAHRVDFTISGGRRLLSVLVVTDDHLFQVIGTAPASRWESTQEDMMRMARSFTTP